jgi:hypothetical protein
MKRLLKVETLWWFLIFLSFASIVILVLSGCGQDNNPSFGYRPNDNCTVSTVNSPISGSLIQCPDGTSSFVSNGLNGTNPTIPIVQFCPGTTTYPSEFNEIGLCINSQIYAVYSINNGFLSMIPPGYYDSNAMNSTCNFTVLTNCVINN